MKQDKLSNLSRILLFLSGVALVISIFVPLWRIDLMAPQYPEGLKLLIYPNNIGGDVEIINGLNHYIGMKTLHTKDFMEFTILPFIIGFYAILCFLVLILNRKKWVKVLFFLFLLFGIIAMIDFWRWEYNYGHTLDKNAAIIVPGMSYQPPLIGFKQLLNFGAYSFPDIGGWLFIFAGICLLVSFIKESYFRRKKSIPITVLLAFTISLVSCTTKNPEPVKLNFDNCTYCKMTIAEEKFVAELITQNGKLYKFDDIICMINYSKTRFAKSNDRYYIANFINPKQFLDAKKAVFLKTETIKSPMQGNLLAFSEKEAAAKFFPTEVPALANWQQIQQR